MVPPPSTGTGASSRANAARGSAVAAAAPARAPTVRVLATIAPRVPKTLLGDEWHANPPGSFPLTPPTIVGGRVFVAAPDAHRVRCLDADSGKPLWDFTAAGRPDVPPTIHAGLCLVATRSGTVHALRADDGREVWRLRLAGSDRRIVAFGQLESRRPVVGGVLVAGGTAYVVTGRSTDIDGGVTVSAFEPATGKVLWQRTPTTDLKTGFLGVADLLVADGRAVAVGGSNHAMFDPTTGRHLPRGRFDALRGAFRTDPKDEFLIVFGPDGDQHGSLLGRDRRFGRWGGTQHALGVDGRVVAFDATRIFSHVAGRDRKTKKTYSRLRAAPRGEAKTPRWSVDTPKGLAVSALVATKDLLLAAAHQTDPAARTDRLLALSAADGKTVWAVDLPAAVVPDGLAAAGGRIYAVTVDGQVLSIAAARPDRP